MKKFSKRTWVLVGVVAVAAVAAVGGYAYWTTTGAGTGSAATAATGQTLVVKLTPAVSGLTPGGSQPLAGNFDNAGPGSAAVSAVTATVDAFSLPLVPNGNPQCTQADFSVSGVSNNPGVIAVGLGVGTWNGLTLNMANGAGNQDNCKGITVPLTFAAS